MFSDIELKSLDTVPNGDIFNCVLTIIILNTHLKICFTLFFKKKKYLELSRYGFY